MTRRAFSESSYPPETRPSSVPVLHDAQTLATPQPERSLRIGLVVEYFEPLRGGLEQWSYRFVRQLLARGHEVHIVSREFAESTHDLAVTQHRISCGRSRLAFAARTQAVLEPLALDVIHDMGAGWYFDVFQPHGGSWTSVTQRKRCLLPPWQRWLKAWLDPLLPRHRQFHKLMARQYADQGQTLLALSQAVADDFRHFHQVAPERIRIIHNGVDTAEFSPQRCAVLRESARRHLGLSPETIVALVVAHNFHLKGVPNLLRAMARLATERCPLHLIVVGGKHLEQWRRRAERLGIGSAVTFVGPIRDSLPYYAAADLYAHPTFYDTCSLVVLEAAACGLPVITSRLNGAAEMFHHGHDAEILDDPADVEALVSAIRRLLDGEARRRMGAAARQTAEQHTFATNVSRILDVYREVLARRGGLPHGYAFWTAHVPDGPPDTIIDPPRQPPLAGRAEVSVPLAPATGVRP